MDSDQDDFNWDDKFGTFASLWIRDSSYYRRSTVLSFLFNLLSVPGYDLDIQPGFDIMRCLGNNLTVETTSRRLHDVGCLVDVPSSPVLFCRFE